MVTRCTSLLPHSHRNTPLCGGAFAWCNHFVSHFAPNAPTESCRCTTRIPWYHQNPAYTHRILFALTACYWLVSYWPVWQTLLPAAPSGWPSARLPNKMMTGFGGFKALRPSKQCSMLSGYHPVCRGGILFSDPHITSVSIYLSETFYLLWLMISDRYSAMKQW